jgi:hypothetical protein
MSKVPITAWTVCIKQLQRLADATDVSETKVQTFSDALEVLGQQPNPLPHAAWKKLVQDVQVTCADTLACLHAWW